MDIIVQRQIYTSTCLHTTQTTRKYKGFEWQECESCKRIDAYSDTGFSATYFKGHVSMEDRFTNQKKVFSPAQTQIVLNNIKRNIVESFSYVELNFLSVFVE